MSNKKYNKSMKQLKVLDEMYNAKKFESRQLDIEKRLIEQEALNILKRVSKEGLE